MEDNADVDDIYKAWSDPMINRSLWLSVINQALIDAKSESRKPQKKRDRLKALAWIADKEEDGDFAMVCKLAGVEPEKVRQVLSDIKKGKKTVNFRCLRKPKLINRLIRRESNLNAHSYTQSIGEINGNR